jgi:hypothetical protein
MNHVRFPPFILRQTRRNKIYRGYPERTSGIECGSGFQPRQLNSRLEAAPTEILFNGNLDFPDKQEIYYEY